MQQRIVIRDGEMEAALMQGFRVHCLFGPSGAWVDYDDEQPLSPFVEFLLLKRGILNRNMAGAGI